MKYYVKQHVTQASLAEMNRKSTAIYGLQATDGIGQAQGQPPMLGQVSRQPAMLGQARMQGQAPGPGQAPVHGQAAGQGSSVQAAATWSSRRHLCYVQQHPAEEAKDGHKTCQACNDRGFPNEVQVGHNCGLFLFLSRGTRDWLVHNQFDVSQVLFSREEAEALQGKIAAALKEQAPRTVMSCGCCSCLCICQLQFGKSCLLTCLLGFYLILPLKLVNMSHIQGLVMLLRCRSLKWNLHMFAIRQAVLHMCQLSRFKFGQCAQSLPD